MTRLLGIDRKPGGDVVWLSVVTWVVYMGVTLVVGTIVAMTGLIDVEQAQETGFEDLTLPIEYVLAFIALVVLPPIAEELLFRGYMFGRLRKRFGFWLTTIVVSIVFGIVHMQWNVGIDVAVLSVFLCYLRERTGTIWGYNGVRKDTDADAVWFGGRAGAIGGESGHENRSEDVRVGKPDLGNVPIDARSQ